MTTRTSPVHSPDGCLGCVTRVMAFTSETFKLHYLYQLPHIPKELGHKFGSFFNLCFKNRDGNISTKCSEKKEKTESFSKLSKFFVFYGKWRRYSNAEEDDTFFERFTSIKIKSGDENLEDFVAFEEVEPRSAEDGEEPDFLPEEEPLWSQVAGWDLDDLYSEVLYTVHHMIGCDSISDEKKEHLITFLREVFHVDQEKHDKLMGYVQVKAAPQIVLNVEVIEARELKGKDINGLSDPFCTLSTSNDINQKHNTTMKSNTLSPLWKEHFSFSVHDIQDDILTLEVWDFDPAETVGEKMKRLGEIKSPRGLKNLVKEVAVSAYTRKPAHEFLGVLKIPLNTVPGQGIDKWYPLESRSGHKTKQRGDIRLRLRLGSKKEKDAAMQEYRQLLQVLLVHELDRSKVEAYQWSGTSSEIAESILSQHAIQGSLIDSDIALAQWVVFCQVHNDHPINCKVFPALLEKIEHHLTKGLATEEQERRFWLSSEKLIEKSSNFVRRLHHQSHQNNNLIATQLYYSLNALSTLNRIITSENGCTMKPEKLNITDKITEAAKHGADDFMQSVLEKNPLPPDINEIKVKDLIRIIKLIMSDLKRTAELHQPLFMELMSVNYFKTACLIYDKQLTLLSEPIVLCVCDNMKPLSFNETSLVDSMAGNSNFSMGTFLFELYLNLQQFVKMCSELAPEDCADVGMMNYFTWFKKGVALWLEIALFKAMRRIMKAVALDKLIPVDNFVKHSSSAVDTTEIFYQIKTFWDQLDWPDIEGQYTFVAQILDDICRSSTYYAEVMCKRVEGLNVEDKSGKFEVTDELCLAINNIDYVQAGIKPLGERLGLERIVQALGDKLGAPVEQCHLTLNTVIENTIENVEHKIVEVLDYVGTKMAPVIYRFLLEGSDMMENDHSVEKLMKYLDANLLKLNSQLSQKNFERVLSIIWERASKTIYDLVESNIEKRRPPLFFQKMHETLKVLMQFFYGEKSSTVNDDTLQKIETLLKVHGTETWDLIHQYYKERVVEQDTLENEENGIITVRAQFYDNYLRVEIMNARNLKPMDSNGLCDPYVKIHCGPQHKFPNCAKQRTKTQKRTLFPLFDEIFTFTLTPEERKVKDGILMFTVKDHDVVYSNEFMAEAFLPFNKIPITNPNVLLQDMTQIHIKLSKPGGNPDSEVVQALESRHWDKVARDFSKKQKLKSVPKNI